MFDELSEAEIEIEDCTRIIDFTRCSYSVQASDWVHVIYEKTDSSVNLVQYRIVDDVAAYDIKLMVTPIYLDQGKELKLDETPARVFQVDDKIVLLGAQSYQVYRITDYFPITAEKLCYPIENPSTATILNLSSPQNLYSRANLRRFADLSKVPQQDWYLVVNETQGEIGYHRY